MHAHHQTAKGDYPDTTIGFGHVLIWSRSVHSLQRASEDDTLQEAPPLDRRKQKTRVVFVLASKPPPCVVGRPRAARSSSHGLCRSPPT
eukprot:6560861-Pyramimonas_sp.AAC.1